MPTDPKNLLFPSLYGIMQKIEYPGVAQLVARLLWEQDAAGSNPVTRTTFLRKTACLGGFSSFFVLVFVFKAIAVQRWFQGKKSDWSMSKDSR